MPIFTGENPDMWLLRAEHLFYLYKYSKAEQNQVIIIVFEGDTLLLYQWENKR